MLTKYQDEIKQMWSSQSNVEILENKQYLGDWSQEMTEKFYNFCLENEVIPRIEFKTYTIMLEGLIESVSNVNLIHGYYILRKF